MLDSILLRVFSKHRRVNAAVKNGGMLQEEAIINHCRQTKYLNTSNPPQQSH